ncbi:preprotein translocase subunit SecD [Candidatus Woesearchaeota archaeon]|nr:preprotein translocase subunit SecD [Candidatus Woesearchaeota archaeon]
MKFRKMLKNPRVIILVIAFILALVAIQPNPFVDGVAIQAIEQNSSASQGGMHNPLPNTRPLSKERIIAINNEELSSIREFYDFVSTLKANDTVLVRTNKAQYRLLVQVPGSLGISVQDAPMTNIRKGLDLQGGTRVLLRPAEKVSQAYLNDVMATMEQRLNVYGLSDIVLRSASDLTGTQYILVEIAGASQEDVRELLARQGKFEAKVANATVFRGGRDITYVCRTADCSGIDPNRGCGASAGGWACAFAFSIALSPEAAQAQADATRNLEVIKDGNNAYLSEKLVLYLDDRAVDQLSIGADLKGKAATNIQISGSGAGASEQEAVANTLANMRRLQTVLITGTLPVKLEIVKVDSISPLLGSEFVKNSVFIGLLAILVVTALIYIRYRKLTVSLPIIFIMLIEIFITIGFASAIGWTIDLAGIAGLIVAVGTGVNDQIVIADEMLKGESRQVFDWKKKIKNAFFIIFAAFFTVIAAMLPLLFAGAGLLKGFALITIAGVSIGVFITRPAYAAMVEILLRD